MNAIVDMQLFKVDDQQFIIKELAVIKNKKVAHCVFKPPFPFEELSLKYKKQAKWLMRNHHCIKWNEGEMEFEQCKKILQKWTSNADTIYVKGKEKAGYLREVLDKNIVELPETPSLKLSTPSCLFHSSERCRCSLKTVRFLESIYKI